MNRLEHVGPKPIISATGIDFDKNHDDKYNYLPALIELIKALDHDYFENKQYIFETNPQKLSSREIWDALNSYCPDLENRLQEKEKQVTSEIEEKLETIEANKNLGFDAKTAYKNNVKIMRDYLMKFASNEVAYNCALHKLAQIVTKDHIDYIIVPMFQKFAYVLHQLQDVLKDQRHPVDTQLDILEEDGEMIAKLKVITLV